MTVPVSELLFSDLIGDWPREPRLSEWMLVPQEDINDFGRVTRDPDPNHVDPAWARAHSRFGGPIAFGFQTLALLTCLAKSARVIPIDADLVNYGFDRVRFTSPIPAGAQIRGRFTIKGVQCRSKGGVRVHIAAEVEVLGADKLALAADWLALMDGAAPS